MVIGAFDQAILNLQKVLNQNGFEPFEVALNPQTGLPIELGTLPRNHSQNDNNEELSPFLLLGFSYLLVVAMRAKKAHPESAISTDRVYSMLIRPDASLEIRYMMAPALELEPTDDISPWGYWKSSDIEIEQIAGFFDSKRSKGHEVLSTVNPMALVYSIGIMSNVSYRASN